eukprot:5333555-Pleurochrysis_carterae.AAC.1
MHVCVPGRHDARDYRAPGATSPPTRAQVAGWSLQPVRSVPTRPLPKRPLGRGGSSLRPATASIGVTRSVACAHTRRTRVCTGACARAL